MKEQLFIPNDRLLEILNWSCRFYFLEGQRNQKFLNLMSARYGLTALFLKEARVGYAPGFGLWKFLIKKGFQEFELMQSGLFYKAGVEFFRDRIMFPYISGAKVRYFVGRSMSSSTVKKYIKMPTFDGSIGYLSHPSIMGEFILGEDEIGNSDFVVSVEGAADGLMAKFLKLPWISPVTKHFSQKQLTRIVEILKGKKVYVIGDTEPSGGGQKGAFQTAQKLANLGLEVYVLTIPLEDVTADNHLLDEAFKRDIGKIDFNEWGRRHGKEALNLLLPTAVKIEAEIIERKIRVAKQKVYTDKLTKIISTNPICDKGDFNLVIRTCAAIKELWFEIDHIPYELRRMLLAFAINTRNGSDVLMSKWPSETTALHIRSAQKSGLCPYSCKKLQEIGVCKIGKHPIRKGQCMPKRRSKNGELLEASPIRFAYGVKRAFLVKKDKED